MNFYYLRKEWGHRLKNVLGSKYVANRYSQMYHDISVRKPKRILEIGTNDGLNAVRMMKLAGSGASYFGFDLFEDLDEASYTSEFALRTPSKGEVESHLRRRGVQIAMLQSGNTRLSLPQATLPKMDLIFIDGGHSEETVGSDWANCEPLMHDQTIVYFDDYPRWGIGPVVDAIDRDRYDVTITKEFDEFPDVFSGKSELVRFHLARVCKRLR